MVLNKVIQKSTLTQIFPVFFSLINLHTKSRYLVNLKTLIVTLARKPVSKNALTMTWAGSLTL